LVRCLREGRDEVSIPQDVAAAARRAVQRMITLGSPGGGE
jgi:quinolinate synthase